MTLSITLPQLNPKSASTKDLIISILSNEWPLTAKELHFRVQKNGGKAVSYQAIHKMLWRLEFESVLSKTGKDYELDKQWVSNLKEFADDLNTRFELNKSKYDISPNFRGPYKMRFNDYSLYCVTMADIFRRKILIGNGPNIGVGFLRHAYWPLRFNFKDFEVLRRMIKNADESYAIIKYDSPFDKWVQRQWLSGGFGRIKIGVEFEGGHDIMVHGNSICETKYSDETKQIIDNIYTRTSNLGELFKEYFATATVKKEMRIDLTITKNPQMANLIRKQVMSHFK